MNEFAKQEYARWLQNCTGETLAELRAMEGDEALIEQRFGHHQTFGTAGIRSIMGAGIACLNDYTVRQAARGLAAYLTEAPGKRTCAIGYDCRHNSRRYA